MSYWVKSSVDMVLLLELFHFDYFRFGLSSIFLSAMQFCFVYRMFYLFSFLTSHLNIDSKTRYPTFKHVPEQNSACIPIRYGLSISMKKPLKACFQSFFSSFIFFLGAFRNTGYQRSFQNLQVASSDRSTLKFFLERFTVYICSFEVFRKFAQKFVPFWNCKLSFLAIK